MKKILKKILKTILLFAGTIIGLLLLYIVFNLNLFHKRKILSSTEIKTYLQNIDKESSDPFKYVADKFNNHSVVFLGELHKRKQDLEFFSNLIPIYIKLRK
jgi:amino acid transporter